MVFSCQKLIQSRKRYILYLIVSFFTIVSFFYIISLSSSSLLFFSHINPYNSTTEINTDIRQENYTKLAEYLISNYERAIAGTIPFYPIYITPGVFIANHLAPVLDYILYAIFTNACIFISVKGPTNFYDYDLPYFIDFLNPRYSKLGYYMQFPPKDPTLYSMLNTSIFNSFGGYSTKQDLGKWRLTENDLVHYVHTNKFKSFKVHAGGFVGHGSKKAYQCNSEPCRNYVRPLKPNENVIIKYPHPPNNFMVSHHFRYSIETMHLFKNKKRMEYLCELDLCDGLDLNYDLKDDVDYYGPAQIFGEILAGNIMRSLFKFDGGGIFEEYFEKERKKVKGVLVGIHWRSVRVGTKTDTIVNAIHKVIKTFPNIPTFTVYIGIDSLTYNPGTKFLSIIQVVENSLNISLKSEKEYLYLPNGRKKEVNFVYHHVLDSYKVGEYEGPFKLLVPVLVDFYMYTISDLLIVSETSSFSAWVLIMNENTKYINPCVMRANAEQGRHYTADLYDSLRGIDNCVSDIPVQVAEKCMKRTTRDKCKFDYPPYGFYWNVSNTARYEDILLERYFKKRT